MKLRLSVSFCMNICTYGIQIPCLFFFATGIIQLLSKFDDTTVSDHCTETLDVIKHEFTKRFLFWRLAFYQMHVGLCLSGFL